MVNLFVFIEEPPCRALAAGRAVLLFTYLNEDFSVILIYLSSSLRKLPVR